MVPYGTGCVREAYGSAQIIFREDTQIAGFATASVFMVDNYILDYL